MSAAGLDDICRLHRRHGAIGHTGRHRRRLITGADTWLPVPASYQALTAAQLPPRIREEFEFPYGAAEQRDVQQLAARIRRVYRFLPARLRYVGPY